MMDERAVQVDSGVEFVLVGRQDARAGIYLPASSRAPLEAVLVQSQHAPVELLGAIRSSETRGSQDRLDTAWTWDGHICVVWSTPRKPLSGERSSRSSRYALAWRGDVSGRDRVKIADMLDRSLSDILHALKGEGEEAVYWHVSELIYVIDEARSKFSRVESSRQRTNRTLLAAVGISIASLYFALQIFALLKG